MKKGNFHKNYQTLAAYSKDSQLILSTLALIEWDQETYMPKEGHHLKEEMNQLFKELYHKRISSKKMASLLHKLVDMHTGKIKDTTLSQREQASVRELRRDHLLATKVPSKLEKELAKTTANTLTSWMKAREEDNFRHFLPSFKKLVELNRKKAEHLGYQDHPYDAMLDMYEPDMKTKTVQTLFSRLKDKLLVLIKEIEQHQPKEAPLPPGEFPVAHQQNLSHEMIKKMGLVESEYHLGETTHPFCLGLYPKDIRLTTHFYPDNFVKALWSTIHEAGHALYENNLPLEDYGTPLCQAASTGVHESQSRIWETFIGHSTPFCKFLYPRLKSHFPDSFKTYSLEDLIYMITHVKKTGIRIYSDEVTYNLHIMIRTEIEIGLMDGSLKPQDLPDAFNAKMKEYLGIHPTDLKTGCLQDVHWAFGYLGYFPTYTLGNLYAGMLYKALLKEISNLHTLIESGEFSPILRFLKEKIHRYGREYSPLELIERASSMKFSEEPYLEILKKRYLP